MATGDMEPERIGPETSGAAGGGADDSDGGARSSAQRHADSTFDAVVFSPHPDDVEFTMAGTIIRLVEAGKRVLQICLTRGESGTWGTPEKRRAEFEAANRIMGSTGMMLDFPDTAVTNDYEGKLKIARLIRTHRPRVVFAPYHTNRFGHLDGSANVDHYTTGALCRDGLKLARFRRLLPEFPPHEVAYLYYYMVPKDLVPTMVVDVTSVMDRVHEAVLAYETQMSIQRRENRIFELLDTMRAWSGIRIGARYGEAFLSDESLAFGPLEFFGPR